MSNVLKIYKIYTIYKIIDLKMTLLRAYLSKSKVKKVLATKPGEAGFSLIELVVVVAVLAVLSAIAIPQFTDISMRARTSAATNTLATMAKECAVKLATDPANATVIVPDLEGYKSANAGTDGFGFHEDTHNAVKTDSAAGTYRAPGYNYICATTKIFGFVSDTLAEYPSFYYNNSTGEKRCTRPATNPPANAALATRGCANGTNW